MVSSCASCISPTGQVTFALSSPSGGIHVIQLSPRGANSQCTEIMYMYVCYVCQIVSKHSISICNLVLAFIPNPLPVLPVYAKLLYSCMYEHYIGYYHFWPFNRQDFPATSYITYHVLKCYTCMMCTHQVSQCVLSFVCRL